MMFRPFSAIASPLLLSSILLPRAASAQETRKVPLNEAETTKAWEAFNKQEYREAIKYADLVIDEFSNDADAMQAELTRNNVPPPRVQPDEKEKKAIFARGVLNDVATCLFIKGESLQHLEDQLGARRAYEAACKLTYARTWDPQGDGFFWNAASRSCTRAKRIRIAPGPARKD